MVNEVPAPDSSIDTWVVWSVGKSLEVEYSKPKSFSLSVSPEMEPEKTAEVRRALLTSSIVSLGAILSGISSLVQENVEQMSHPAAKKGSRFCVMYFLIFISDSIIVV